MKAQTKNFADVIEDADYDGHSLTLLRRIAGALGKKLRVEFYSQPVARQSTRKKKRA